jgi:hypothetical protein
LRRLIAIDKPCQRVRYELQEIGRPALDDVIEEWMRAHSLRAPGAAGVVNRFALTDKSAR